VAEGGASVRPRSKLIDEKRHFFECMSENHAKLKDDQLPALVLFKKYKSRIPKIASPCRVS